MSTCTPDGRRLLVRRERKGWVVQCGNGKAACSGLLDVALIEAIRGDHDPEGNRGRVDYAEWVRELADSLERSSS